MTSNRRRAELAKIHMAKKELSLDEDSYRDLLDQLTGKRSAGDLDGDERGHVLDYMKKQGFKTRPKKAPKRTAHDPMVAKIRALWIALHNLGEVRNKSDKALTAYVKRMTGVEALTWMDGDKASVVINALREWCGRVGYGVGSDTMKNKQKLLRAQWKRLGKIGALRTSHEFALDEWISHRIVPRSSAVLSLDTEELDRAADELGKWLRGAMAKAKKA